MKTKAIVNKAAVIGKDAASIALAIVLGAIFVVRIVATRRKKHGDK